MDRHAKLNASTGLSKAVDIWFEGIWKRRDTQSNGTFSLSTADKFANSLPTELMLFRNQA